MRPGEVERGKKKLALLSGAEKYVSEVFIVFLRFSHDYCEHWDGVQGKFAQTNKQTSGEVEEPATGFPIKFTEIESFASSRCNGNQNNTN